MQLTLPIPMHFSWPETLRNLGRNAQDGLQQVEGEAVYKALMIEGQAFVVRVSLGSGELLLETDNVQLPAKVQAQVLAYVRQWLDTDRDLSPFYELLAHDMAFSYMPERFAGLRLTQMPSLHEAISWCIIGQQINLAFAFTLKNRLVARFVREVEGFDKRLALFPAPGILANADEQELRQMQLSGSKAAAIVRTSAMVAEGSLSVQNLQALPALSERLAALTAIRGVGPWTANYVLMRSLGQMDVAPYGDAGLRAALYKHGLIIDTKDRTSEAAILARYPGWQAYLTFYLWRSLVEVV